MTINISPATLDDVRAVAAAARQQDRAEVFAASGRAIEDVLPEGFDKAAMSWAMRVNDDICGVAGVCPAPSNPRIGIVWMIGTSALVRHQRAFLRVCRSYADEMMGEFSMLTNMVHAENTVSIRWLGKLGFTISPKQVWGAKGEEFHLFWRMSDV